MDESGSLIRLFPVPFRLIKDDQKFRKWQWINARVRKIPDDHRTESHRISIDTIEVEGDPIPTSNAWAHRLEAIKDVEVFQDFSELDEARQSRGVTLGLLRPARLMDLVITSAGAPEWTAEEIAKLVQAQQQGNLFDAGSEQRSLRLLRKLPFDFHYVYECDVDGAPRQYKHKLVDWEAGALYWNVHDQTEWRHAFRSKYLDSFVDRDVLFLMGNIHRFPAQWLIVSVIYPPKPPDAVTGQGQLFSQ